MEKTQALRYRIAPLEMTPSEFRKAGYRLIDQVAELLCTLPERPVAPNESPATLRALLGSHSPINSQKNPSSLPLRLARPPFDALSQEPGAPPATNLAPFLAGPG